ncbi:hypothetical protein FOPG_19115 [Fusarium oxysporum f. sp. conglutinans race 2 54008]|uniref:Uncharacterized protein n=1 Tax=Fusarium oxysporum f. sp. conglutinans race 2 54008 TaxID=1089457 RepID=X0HTW9_FUSOX|nr:hypothetical protein FOPG_19115 [Fusarium oxysporum f. sp. conglutinans race 2 54008]
MLPVLHYSCQCPRRHQAPPKPCQRIGRCPASRQAACGRSK